MVKMDNQDVTFILKRAFETEHRLIFYYPQLAKLVKDEELAQKIRILGEESEWHAKVTSEAIAIFGGEPVTTSFSPLPVNLNLKSFFREQLEYEKLALWSHNRLAEIVPVEIAPKFRKIAAQEERHIRLVEEILQQLE